MTQTIATLNLLLKDHPVIRHIPKWDTEDTLALALYDSLEAGGHLDPIRITEDRFIIDPDSRERWAAAKRLQLPEIPVQIVPDEAVATALLDTLLLRHHYTKSALAYLVFPTLETVLAENRARSIKNLKKANVSPNRHSVPVRGNTIAEIAARYDICVKYFQQAKALHAAFDASPELREKFESSILEGEISLGGCLAGIAGATATVGKTPQVAHQLDLFDQIGHQFAIRAGYLTSMDANQRIKAKQSLTSHFSQLDEDVLDLVIDAAKAARKTASAKVA